MSLESKLGHHFKPEIKNYGAQEFAKGTVFISNHSDTQIQASMKSMIPIRISLRSESISSPSFTASCNCSVFTKGHLCKHVWAVLLTVEKNYPDFLDSKTEIDLVQKIITPTESALKKKQSEYKKEQYQKQKVWLKSQQLEKKKKLTEAVIPNYPKNIKAALDFFSINGFPMDASTDPDFLNKAKKSLYRVFHPDKGGSHSEAVDLNKHFDVLIDFLQQQKK